MNIEIIQINCFEIRESKEANHHIFKGDGKEVV